jgi:hypothetical protein
LPSASTFCIQDFKRRRLHDLEAFKCLGPVLNRIDAEDCLGALVIQANEPTEAGDDPLRLQANEHLDRKPVFGEDFKVASLSRNLINEIGRSPKEL